MHGFVTAGAAPREKQSNLSYEEEHLVSWPVYVRRYGPADWLQSKGLLATSKTCPACIQPMNMQTCSDVTDKYRYNLVKHNSLWYASVTDGDIVTLPAGSPQGLGMGPSLQSPI